MVKLRASVGVGKDVNGLESDLRNFSNYSHSQMVPASESSGRFMRGKALQEMSMTSFSLTLPTWELRPYPAPYLGRSRQRHINENRAEGVHNRAPRPPAYSFLPLYSYHPDMGAVEPLLLYSCLLIAFTPIASKHLIAQQLHPQPGADGVMGRRETGVPCGY